ncbi:hypothetical protein BDZ90DRAFT_230638 [Jaminaea rosea]|uniref:UNC-45/Cro1/She4 central domain-containing protein n=1 Tax=Jaminaea rosea TaxID=1569628 RepID=A0A316UZQ8_9BASI|nr:hypothetical protein BDZ90DRAFT_230638 [Jaminaea rosea]PWN29791.1 hypothetical protein BDZ90DRAFT_230638 [Jaminaea rosea]
MPGAAASIEQELDKLSLSSNPDQLIAAFEADADQRSRALATLSLSRAASDQASLASLYAPLASRLEDVAEAKGYAAALRLLSTLSSISPPAVQGILFANAAVRPLWTSAFPKVTSPDPLLDLLRADLLAALVSDAAMKTDVLKAKELVAWLRAAGPQHSETEDERVALVAHLALYKLHQRPSSSQLPADAGEELQRSSSDDDTLLLLSRSQVLTANAQALADESSRISLLAALEALSYLSSGPPSRKDLIANDAPFLQALCAMPGKLGQQKNRRAVFPSRGGDEGKASSSYQMDSTLSKADGLAPADTSVQYALSTIILNLVAYPPALTGEEKQMQKLKAMANAKQQEKGQGGQSAPQEEAEPSAKIDARVNKAMQAGVADTLVSLVLSGGVDASNSTALNPSTAVRDTVSNALLNLTVKQDKQQRGRLAQAGGAKALVALSSDVIARLKQQRERKQENQSKTGSTPQPASASAGVPPPLSSLQALARLCVTHSPALLFGGGSSGSSASSTAVSATLPFLTALYLHLTSNPLQRFEALLALTNVASLSPEAGRAVASAKLRDELKGQKGGLAGGEGPTTILDGLESSILLEGNDMIRRAAVELLCNLVQDETAFARWSGEEENEASSKAQRKPQQITSAEGGEERSSEGSRARHRLHLLVALCAPAAANAMSGETSLPTRMASAGAVATLCSSAIACEHLLSLRARTLNIVARLIRPGVAVKAGAGGQQEAKIVELTEGDHEVLPDSNGGESDDDVVDEEEESGLEQQDAVSWAQGASHARASLALRGVTIASCLVQYVAWRREQKKGDVGVFKAELEGCGMLEALKGAALEGAREMQQGAAGQGVKEGAAEQEARAMRGEVTRLCIEALKEMSKW